MRAHKPVRIVQPLCDEAAEDFGDRVGQSAWGDIALRVRIPTDSVQSLILSSVRDDVDRATILGRGHKRGAEARPPPL